MTEGKDKQKDQDIPEVVGLDDDDLEDGNENEESSEQPKESLLKRFLMPAVVGGASLLLALAAASFFSGSGEMPSEELSKETEGQSAKHGEAAEAEKDSVDWLKELERLAEERTSEIYSEDKQNHKERIDEALARMEAEYNIMQQQNEMSFDTEAVMAELGFLDYVNEQETEEEGEKETSGQSPDDTVSGGITVQDSVDTLNWLEKEMQKLSSEEAEINRERSELEQEKRKLEAQQRRIDRALARIEQAESDRVAKLARLYDGMQAENVADLFENLSDDVVLKILPRMKSANAAKILGLMPPKRAARISTKMITVLD